MDRDVLESYLNDHLAGSVIGLEVARRCAGRADDPELAVSMSQIATEIEQDQAYLLDVIRELGFRRSMTKSAMAVVGSWASWGRSVLSDRGLTELEDLETLCIGVWGKRLLWGTLGRLAVWEGAFDKAALDRLAQKAEAQEKELMRLRDAAVARAFAP